jgi:hypothetical protein
MVEMVARVRADRLLRWSVYATVPFLWFALALVNPFVLLLPPLVTLLLWLLMRYGIVDRDDPVVDEDPDFF